MKRTRLLALSMLGAGALLVVPGVSNAVSGTGWDAIGDYSASYPGERIDPMGMSSSRDSLASEDFDVLNLDKQVPVSGQSYIGTSLVEPGGDADAFRVGAK